MNQLDPKWSLSAQDLKENYDLGAPEHMPEDTPTMNRLKGLFGTNYAAAINPKYRFGQIDIDDKGLWKDMAIVPTKETKQQKRAAAYRALGEEGAITPAELKDAEKYRTAQNYPGYWFLGGVGRDTTDRLPLSRAQREARKEAREFNRLAGLNAVFKDGGVGGAEYAKAKAAYDKYLNYRAANAPTPTHWNGNQWVENDDAYNRDLRALRNYKKKLPASITRPELARMLNQTGLKGSVPSDAWYENHGLDSTLHGQSLATMSKEDRQKHIGAFANLVGTLNVKPIYDPRLTSVESARYVFPEDDYNIQLVDMDQNTLTPGVVVISTKFTTTNRKGDTIPAGTIVAVNGYRIQDGSEATSMARLKDMMYYHSHPTLTQRKNDPMNRYIRQTFGSKPASSGIKVISEWVKEKLVILYDVVEPTPQRPVFMQISPQQDKTIYYKFTTTAWNTLCARIAELIFNHVLAPILMNRVSGITLAQDALKHLTNGDEALRPQGAFARNEYGDVRVDPQQAQYGTRDWAHTGTAITPLNLSNPYTSFLQIWKDGFFATPVLNAMLRDKEIIAMVKDVLTKGFNNLDQEVVKNMIMAAGEVVMKFIINPPLTLYIPVNSSIHVSFVSWTDAQALAQSQGSWGNVVTASATSKEELGPKYGIKFRGDSLIFKARDQGYKWSSAFNTERPTARFSLPADYTPRNLNWEAALAEAFPQQPAAAAAAPPLALPGGNMQALLP